VPTGAVKSSLEAKPWGFKEFVVRDPLSNLLLAALGIEPAEVRLNQGASLWGTWGSRAVRYSSSRLGLMRENVVSSRLRWGHNAPLAQG
jgi:hypothetical protein